MNRNSTGSARRSSASATSLKPRRKTFAVRVGTLQVGGRSPVSVQSMTKTRTDDVRATLRQIRRLERAGCELVRIAVPDAAAAAALPAIRHRIPLPLVADVHFDYRLALAALRAGFDKIRINPGNIGATWKINEVIKAAKDSGAAIRIGVNAGSIGKSLLRKHGHPTVAAMVESMAACLEPFGKLRFKNIVLSAKSTDVPETIAVYRELSRRWRYPLHLGLTEAGPPFEGAIRSTAALSVLLLEGIGDTVRVSLTGDPVHEVRAGYELLAALGLRRRGPLVYSCPTCGRTGINVIRLTHHVKQALREHPEPLKIAVMGCVVNGPGEAREADFGIAGGKGR
ncbi:flavodoxin-dependent (E)-4-hydroxy-3-methylbut-2-enyl-diphosphate synthase, partial [candidate division WOR-3 bacterium]|nr:flavodoxin-dependent (E)-4-hydroxy-3-methylbut-2-enyl-diphosphate synthase [candidate division WOR-3 bacterium]